MDDTLQMLKELTEANGVPGQEGPVREVMARYLEGTGEIITDNLGSIVARKNGNGAGDNAPKVLIAGHMDEVGFMVTLITDEGFLKFRRSAVGGSR